MGGTHASFLRFMKNQLTLLALSLEKNVVCVSVLWGRSMDSSMVQIFQHDVKDTKPSMHGHGKPSPSRNHSQLSNRAHRTRKYYKPMVRSTDQNKLSNKCKMETTA